MIVSVRRKRVVESALATYASAENNGTLRLTFSTRANVFASYMLTAAIASFVSATMMYFPSGVVIKVPVPEIVPSVTAPVDSSTSHAFWGLALPETMTFVRSTVRENPKILMHGRDLPFPPYNVNELLAGFQIAKLIEPPTLRIPPELPNKATCPSARTRASKGR